MAVKFLEDFPWKHVGIFVAGSLFGTYGVEALSTDKAKKVYTEVTAAALRVKDEVLKQTTVLQENANDILEDAKALNENRVDKPVKQVCEEVFEDLAGVEISKKAPAEKKAPAKKPAAKKAPAKK